MKRKIEILAPAGSLEAMQAAMEAGCDAVYIGGSSFGARAYADNLSEESLLEAIDYAHLHGKALYLTVNTLLKERELEQKLYRYMERFYEQGLDAAIVQDTGVLRFLHTHFPELPLHASTQMTITAAGALEQLAGMGVTRIVTARELSFQEVRQIREQTDLEIESFVHGALCYCYSGQCLFSSMSGNRSGNRGRCTQPCRMEYQVTDQAGKRLPAAPYVLSPKDICTLEWIPELVEAGIDSFKIEGRMKRPEYAALTAKVYRKWTDRYLDLRREGYQEYCRKNPKEMEEDIRQMADLYNRGGFSGGYYQQKNGKNMMSMGRPNHHGVEAVTVESVRKNNMELRALQPLNAQDVIEIRRKGSAEYEFTLKNPIQKGETFSSRFLPGSRIAPGMTGFRTKNAALLTELQENYLNSRKKLPISGCFHAEEGKPMELRLWRTAKEDVRSTISEQQGEESKLVIVTCQGSVAEQAKNQPVTTERVEQALRKTGDSLYEWEELQIELEGDLFLAMSAVNQLRREGIAMLEEAYLAGFRRKPEQAGKSIGNSIEISGGKPGQTQTKASEVAGPADMLVSVAIERMEQLKVVLEAKSVQRIYLSVHELDSEELREAAHYVKEKGKEVFIRLPRIFRAGTERMLEQDRGLWQGLLQQADGVLLHTLEEVSWLNRMQRELGLFHLQVILGENLYNWNKEAREFWNDRGIHAFTTSIELTEDDLKPLDLVRDEMIVYGYQPLMVSAQCVMNNTLGCMAGKKENDLLYLTDQKDRRFPVMNVCRYCYNIIYQHEPLNLTGSLADVCDLGVSRIRLEFTMEGEQEVRRIINAWEREKKIPGGTEGHFRRGVE